MTTIAPQVKPDIVKEYTDPKGTKVVHLRGREIAIDIGNAEIKTIAGSEKSRYVIPNVLAQMNFGNILEREKNIEDGIRIEVQSDGLNRSWGTMAFGKLAAEKKGKKELSFGSVKAKEDQTIIGATTAMALDAVKNFPVETIHEEGETKKVCKAVYCVTAGLPIYEFKNDTPNYRKLFRERLMGVHVVRFGQVADPYDGVEVQILVYDVKLASEGKAAHLELTTDQYGRQSNQFEWAQNKYLLCDDGGGTFDVVPMRNGFPDNEAADGFDEGINQVLDQINREIYKKFKDTFPSRKALADHLMYSRKHELDKTVAPYPLFDGKPKDIAEIVEQNLAAYAERIYDQMKEMWFPGCQAAAYVGGASGLIRPYLAKLNGGEGENAEGFIIYFLPKQKSFWILAEAYYKIGRTLRKSSKKKVINLLPVA